jgi:SAM-dependent methyltransferase
MVTTSNTVRLPGQRVVGHSYVAAVPAYALLLRASANRVYGDALPTLATAELEVLDREVLGGTLTSVERRRLGGVDYLVGEAAGELDEQALQVLSNASALHALFRQEGDVLRPLPVTPLRRQDEDVVTIQRYVGKTNEALTHLLVNVALAAGAGAFGRLLAGERVRVLDPVCGRGTSLNRAVVYGADALGVEHDKRDVDAYEAFLLGWLKDKRLKHRVERARLRKGRPTPAHRLTVRYGPTRDDADHRVVDVVHDDTTRIRDHLPSRSVDALVADLPYGVQHGATTEGRAARTPEALLEQALGGWCDVLRPGAGVALSWNLRTLARPRLVELVAAHGLELVRPAGDETFVHRVDRSITRDVLVARRH